MFKVGDKVRRTGESSSFFKTGQIYTVEIVINPTTIRLKDTTISGNPDKFELVEGPKMNPYIELVPAKKKLKYASVYLSKDDFIRVQQDNNGVFKANGEETNSEILRRAAAKLLELAAAMDEITGDAD